MKECCWNFKNAPECGRIVSYGKFWCDRHDEAAKKVWEQPIKKD